MCVHSLGQMRANGSEFVGVEHFTGYARQKKNASSLQVSVPFASVLHNSVPFANSLQDSVPFARAPRAHSTCKELAESETEHVARTRRKFRAQPSAILEYFVDTSISER